MDNQESLRVLDGFVKAGGTVDIGRIGPSGCAAIAVDPRRVWVLLMRREGETLPQLLDRLERRLSRCLMHGAPYNELEMQRPGPGQGAAAAAVVASGLPTSSGKYSSIGAPNSGRYEPWWQVAQ